MKKTSLPSDYRMPSPAAAHVVAPVTLVPLLISCCRPWGGPPRGTCPHGDQGASESETRRIRGPSPPPPPHPDLQPLSQFSVSCDLSRSSPPTPSIPLPPYPPMHVSARIPMPFNLYSLKRTY